MNSSVASGQVTVQDILHERPYLAWERIPLAAALCTLDYDDAARAAILDRLRDGAALADLAPWLVETADLPELESALSEGRTAGWMGRYREQGGFLPPICGGSDDGDDDDRSIPPTAVIIPPELEVLSEILDELVVFEPEPCKCGRRGTCDGDCPADAIDDRTPDEHWTDPRRLPPIAGGAVDPRDDEPAYSDAEWDEMCRLSMEESGYPGGYWS